MHAKSFGELALALVSWACGDDTITNENGKMGGEVGKESYLVAGAKRTSCARIRARGRTP